MDKPKAYIWNGELFWACEYEVIKEKGDDAEPLYTAPPKREWVGLTEYMRIKLADRFHISMDAVEAIEAKLKEKNT
jgi:hypothetical protein